MAKIFCAILRTQKYPDQWKVEHGVQIPKSSNSPENLDELRIISKTNFMSKIFEGFIVDWLLPTISPYLDISQFGGFKGLSTTHYLIKFLDYIHSILDQNQPKAAMAALIDLSKAFNRVDHNLIIEDLFLMKCPSFLLRFIFSYLSGRILIVNYHGAAASPKPLPGGAPAGCYLGGLIFVIKFNGALMRPKIARPIQNSDVFADFGHWKYFDDVSVASSVNLKQDLQTETCQRPKPLNFDEKSELSLPKEKNRLNDCLKMFEDFTIQQKLKINQEKTKLMLFNMSQKYRFPLELGFSDGVHLEVIESAKILGVVISNTLKWSLNTDYIITKAMKRLWTLRKLQKCGLSQQFILEVYKKEIRSILEYNVPVWNEGLTQKDSQKIEKIQKIVLKMLLKSNYSSYTEACNHYKIEKLHSRRQKLCLNFAKKEFKKPKNGIVKKIHSKSKRISNKRIVLEPKARTTRYYKSAIPYMAILLNHFNIRDSQ